MAPATFPGIVAASAPQAKAVPGRKTFASDQPLGEEFCREELCPRVSPAAMRKMEEHRHAGHAIIF